VKFRAAVYGLGPGFDQNRKVKYRGPRTAGKRAAGECVLSL